MSKKEKERLLECKLKEAFGKESVRRNAGGLYIISFMWDADFHMDEQDGPTEHEEFAWVHSTESGFSVEFHRFGWAVAPLIRKAKVNSAAEAVEFIREARK